MLKQFPIYRQLDAMDCGPTCIRMIAAHYGKHFSLESLRASSFISREGVSAKGISLAAERLGFRTATVQLPFSSGSEENLGLIDAPFPLIVHWKQNHFVVVFKVDKKYIWIADPEAGKHKLTHAEFKKNWLSDSENGVAILLELTPKFYEQEGEEINKAGFGYLFKYLIPYRKLLFQLFIGLLLGSLFQLIFPFLTQAIVDIGIENQNIGFIWLILVAQLMIFVGQVAVQVLQSWILLHVSTRINVSLISDFLIKMMRLPIGFFDTKMIGDLMQRIGDHTRIETFLTSATLQIIFSVVNFIVFGAVLLIYNVNIFLIFLVSSVLFVLWIFLFLKKRRAVDYRRFQELSNNQSSLIEMIQGMQ